MKRYFRYIAVCVFVFAGLGSITADDVTNAAVGDKGPTISLDYGAGTASANSVSEFLYFVPLISKTDVTQWISANNTQSAKVTSHCKETDGNSFTVRCQVQFEGEGSSKNIFNYDSMIEYKKQFFKEGETIKRVLEYIEFTGDSTGCFEINGRIDGGIETVEDVIIDFSCEDKSPVIISMYDLECKNGKYDFNKKKNHFIARVNKLTFKRCDEDPAMMVDIASIRPAKAKEGFMASFAGKVLNMFLPPMQIKQSGNDTMLSFGAALNRKEPAFIFPKADNVSTMVAMADSNRNPEP